MTIITEEIARLQHQIEFVLDQIDITQKKDMNIHVMADMQRYADTLDHLVNAKENLMKGLLVIKAGDM